MSGYGSARGALDSPSRSHHGARSVPTKALVYGLLNIISASGIVFANKTVFQTYGFEFTVTLTFIHTVFTMVGMYVMNSLGMFEAKLLPPLSVLPLAGAYVAYIVLCNMSLKLNTVGFYQIMKIAVAPTVLVLDFFLFHKLPSTQVIASVLLVCLGIGLATVTDTQVSSNVTGIVIGLAATLVTALYQIWAGSKQKELQSGSMQLLHQYTPQAAGILALLIPFFEPLGIRMPRPGTILGYNYTAAAVLAIVVSAFLGLLVSLSTFLVIGATSSLTYNIVGHLKTVIILTGGCFLFGDAMPLKKLLGIGLAMVGIVWYTQLKMGPQRMASQRPSRRNSDALDRLLPVPLMLPGKQTVTDRMV